MAKRPAIIQSVPQPVLQIPESAVPSGRWAVGVSGGADSVALLSLLRARADLQLHVVHLDHQTRAGQSTADAEFVRLLAAQWELPCTIATRDQVEAKLDHLPHNRSARYRAARLAFFRSVVVRHGLGGVILAHHADDQAETALHRLIRGSGPAGLIGMSPDVTINGLRILRPVLSARSVELRSHLNPMGQSWREDASNKSEQYLRNRLRRWLADEPELHGAVLTLSVECRRLRDWVRASAPDLHESFAVAELSRLPRVLAHESARRWLLSHGAAPEELSAVALDRLVEMAVDAATAHQLDFPGPVRVHRRVGRILADTRAPASSTSA